MSADLETKSGVSTLLLIMVALVVVAGGLVGYLVIVSPGTQQLQIIERVTLEEAYALIQNNAANQNFVIIDVRTPEEYASGHIENAINLDYYSKTFRDELNELDKNKTYLIYCRTGHRSGAALDIMRELGFREVYDMLEGIVRWEAEGLPLTK
ncbi:MAG: rhodanese-like domain-containing protein [Candidatus Bathyarchaeia archaeon]